MKIYQCPVEGCNHVSLEEYYCTLHGGCVLMDMPVAVVIADTDDAQRVKELIISERAGDKDGLGFVLTNLSITD